MDESAKRKKGDGALEKRKKIKKGVKEILTMETERPASQVQLEEEVAAFRCDKTKNCYAGYGGCFRNNFLT